MTAKHVHHVWHIDITQVATCGGFWVPWWPFSLPPVWPFCWQVVVVIDHFSRAPIARGVFKQAPTAAEVCATLDAGVASSGRAPRHLISDKGTQFTSAEYRAWCAAKGSRPRWGAIGQHGSIAIIERFFRSLKAEAVRLVQVPLDVVAMTAEVDRYLGWYAMHRPHEALRGATPHEVLHALVPRCEQTGMEVRPRYPLSRPRPCMSTRRRVRKRLEVKVSYIDGRAHLPVVELRQIG